ncbi:hypothetical protein QBC36DRAFT_312385 [Triangularia setosa]|uniref:Zeaxanthin epoxidase n=1 Tax=Triangularia setosa TaxID=2587417 RepID=A0AAN6W437_9PEZI|nr:hypothetical protein QBC36DRAFT_312385 [Podospora setosa]
MSSPKHPTRIAIIGAGVIGLLLAQGLQKHGYTVTIYEKQPDITSNVPEWTMILHWAWPVISRMLPDDLLSDIHTAFGDPFYGYDIPFYNAVTGKLMVKIPAECRRMSRTRMRGLCLRGLDVRWGVGVGGMEVVGEDEPVRVYLGNEGQQQTEEADVVIGADGPGSFVRRWLFGGRRDVADAKNSTVAIANGLVRYDNEKLAERLREGSRVCLVATMPGRTFVSAVPWDGRKGRVTLAGNAAHALLPARGQGLSRVLTNVDSLLSLFIDVKDSKLGLKDVIGRYDQELFRRGRKAALGSLEDAKDFMRTEGFETGLRERQRRGSRGLRMNDNV